MSHESVFNRYHADRLAYLEKQRAHFEKQIKATKRKQYAGYLFGALGCTLAAAGFTSFTDEVIDHGLSGIYLGIEVQLLLLFPVVVIVLCFFVSRHYAGRIKKLEEARVPIDGEFYELWALRRYFEKKT